jgi:two-component system response regulator (stage 0 sporulation protein F)
MAKYRVLIVDDQRHIRMVLRAGLQTLLGDDVQVTDVPSGEEAILVISRHPIDLLVADVRLPGISGLELKERTQVRNPGLKVILMTGMPEPKTRREVEKAGADAFFFKPFGLPGFLEAVKVCLGLAPSGGAAPVLDEEEQPPLTLAERLSNLHQELDAIAVILLNDDGQIVAGTSEFPRISADEAMIASLLSLFSAALKVSYLSGANARDWMLFDGKDYDLVLTHVGVALGLLVVLPNAALVDQQTAKVLTSLRLAVKDISSLLDQMGVTTQVEIPAVELASAPAPEPEEVDISEVLPELDAIFSQVAPKVKEQDVDNFWETLSGEGAEEVSRVDGLSYDQARQLGLAPEE